MECYAGQAWLSLHIHLPQQPPHRQHLQRRQGPSRLRRRARREAARKSGSAAVKAGAASESIQPQMLPLQTLILLKKQVMILALLSLLLIR